MSKSRSINIKIPEASIAQGTTPKTVSKKKKSDSDIQIVDSSLSGDNLDSIFEQSFEMDQSAPVTTDTTRDAVSLDYSEDIFEETWTKEEHKPVTKRRSMGDIDKSTTISVSSLQAFLDKGSISDMSGYDPMIKMQQIRDQGQKMLDDFKERGIEVSGIGSETIIKEWDDMKYIGCNRNMSYVDNLISSIEQHGFESPRPIQSVTIGKIAKGGDIIVQATAGNGKTAAFTVGAALGVDPSKNRIQVLILSPTQLLTDQTFGVVKKLTENTGITVHCYRGGQQHTVERDENQRRKIPQIVVGCPGRIKDLIEHDRINLRYIKTVILDEGDNLLQPGFREQIKVIIESLAETVQICLFSATLPNGILQMCTSFMINPAFVILPENQVITELVTQWYVKCTSPSEKDGCIVDIIEQNTKETIIIFFNSCSKLQRVSEILTKYSSDTGNSINHLCVHGKMDSAERVSSITDFSNGKCRILLASDMASRGLDIPSVTLVINYDIPFDGPTYIHRIGRSGRGARLGNSVSLLITDEDKRKMTYLVQMHGIPIKVLRNIKMESKPVAV